METRDKVTDFRNRVTDIRYRVTDFRYMPGFQLEHFSQPANNAVDV